MATKFAIVTAPGCYAGTDTYCHSTHRSLAAAKRKLGASNWRSVIIATDSPYAARGARFPLDTKEIVHRNMRTD